MLLLCGGFGRLPFVVAVVCSSCLYAFAQIGSVGPSGLWSSSTSSCSFCLETQIGMRCDSSNSDNHQLNWLAVWNMFYFSIYWE